jgi:hypothetical protein
MPKSIRRIRSCGLLAVTLILPLALSAVPAHAQDFFGGLFRAFSRSPDPVPAPQPFEYRPDPAGEQPRRKARPRPKPARAEQTAIQKPTEPRTPGDMDNPVPALLTDSTLHPGDMVMFPDGLRVFTGRPGSQHKLADFKPLAQAGKALSRATRKLVAHLLPSENPAWSADGIASGRKLAVNTRDVETTGSVKRKER